MVETILLAFFFSKIKGYKLKPLFKHFPIYIIFFAMFIYLILEVLLFIGQYWVLNIAWIVKPLMLIVFFVSVIYYKLYLPNILGIGFLFVGSILNQIVIKANRGKMPVFSTLTKITGYYKNDIVIGMDGLHCVGTATTKFKYLADIFDIGYSVLSIGDILIRGYAFIAVYYAIKVVNTKNMAE